MIEERTEELAALYALDLLEGEDRTRFEASLGQDSAIRSLVRELRDASAELAHLAPSTPPPAALKDRVLASIIRGGGNSTPTATVVRPPASVFQRVLPWAIAACMAVTASWLGQAYLSLRTEIDVQKEQQALVDLALKSSQAELEAERVLARRQIAMIQEGDARIAALTTELKNQAELADLKITALASLLKNNPEALAVAVWDPKKQEGVLQFAKLPSLDSEHDYQLWVVDPQYPNPVDGGVFSVNQADGDGRVKFRARQPVRAINAFAVTRERKGGVPKAEGPFVLLGK